MLTRTKVETAIGKGFADKLDEEIFTVTINWFYTRRELVETIGCANFIAAARLAKVLKRLNINTPSQLFRTDPFSIARAKGIGEASIFVAMCILDSCKFDVIKWWKWKDTNDVKFSSFKHSAMKRAKKHKQEV